ncbi:hypothetical protein [Escherichia coli]|uniref:hypothetical protein n=1 Tax=Escherichia coli TaxID=562 RepID=UPI0040689557
MQREIVIDYIKQEINPDEKYAFVEYWARGYTQTCLSKLLECAFKNHQNVFFIIIEALPSNENNIRLNYSTNNISLIPVEAIFANCPHETVTGYKYEKGKFTNYLKG